MESTKKEKQFDAVKMMRAFIKKQLEDGKTKLIGQEKCRDKVP